MTVVMSGRCQPSRLTEATTALAGPRTWSQGEPDTSLDDAMADERVLNIQLRGAHSSRRAAFQAKMGSRAPVLPGSVPRVSNARARFSDRPAEVRRAALRAIWRARWRAAGGMPVTAEPHVRVGTKADCTSRAVRAPACFRRLRKGMRTKAFFCRRSRTAMPSRLPHA